MIRRWSAPALPNQHGVAKCARCWRFGVTVPIFVGPDTKPLFPREVACTFTFVEKSVSVDVKAVIVVIVLVLLHNVLDHFDDVASAHEASEVLGRIHESTSSMR